ncbi:uncharacterized protein CLUP02_12164 [Colletotrichum lupini]|uniref:Uncharacterized protein n=1 Tax=Colletotrichum lupini TaxID=145971 RepID=A0A9Q8WKZ9_9PEZI|nr:uncharacterized protein CLUP02_12164 [Colletotrichum lupini]UQC86662.1 hypothetical protein CLUP02_12164 [Colletotrichum lupini]
MEFAGTGRQAASQITYETKDAMSNSTNEILAYNNPFRATHFGDHAGGSKKDPTPDYVGKAPINGLHIKESRLLRPLECNKTHIFAGFVELPREARCLLPRVIGDYGSWYDAVESLEQLAVDHNIPLIVNRSQIFFPQIQMNGRANHPLSPCLKSPGCQSTLREGPSIPVILPFRGVTRMLNNRPSQTKDYARDRASMTDLGSAVWSGPSLETKAIYDLACSHFYNVFCTKPSTSASAGILTNKGLPSERALRQKLG